MFGPQRPMYPNMQWNTHLPPYNPHWGYPRGPRPPVRDGHFQHMNQHRPPFQPGNDNYWCETCDRGFATQDILNKHKQQHEKCNIDGCQFVAHPKVVTKHIQMQHSTGLYKKIANLHKPEEIEKWREERRKKYPTKTNIDKKAAELREKIDRGEKMGLDMNKNRFNKEHSVYNKDNSGYNRDNRTGQWPKRRNYTRHENESKSKFKRTNDSYNNQNKRPAPKVCTLEDRTLKPFAGIQHLEMDSDNEAEIVKETSELFDLIEDDDFEVSKNIEMKSVDVVEPTVCGALSSLMCDYGSTDEEDNNEVVIITSKCTRLETSENIHKGGEIKNVLIHKPNKQEDNKKNTGNIKTENVKQDLEGEKKTENVVQKCVETEKSKENITKDTKQELSQNLWNINKNRNVLVQKLNDKKDSEDILTKDTSQETSHSTKYSNMNENALAAQNLKDTHLKDTLNENFKNDSLETVTRGTEMNKVTDPFQNTIIDQNVDDNDSGPEEVKVEKKYDRFTSSPPESSKPNDVVLRKSTTQIKKPYIIRRKRKLPSSLLQKLLHKEMQQERNIVLQCIRYVRQNNYFD